MVRVRKRISAASVSCSSQGWYPGGGGWWGEYTDHATNPRVSVSSYACVWPGSLSRLVTAQKNTFIFVHALLIKFCVTRATFASPNRLATVHETFEKTANRSAIHTERWILLLFAPDKLTAHLLASSIIRQIRTYMHKRACIYLHQAACAKVYENGRTEHRESMERKQQNVNLAIICSVYTQKMWCLTRSLLLDKN